MSVSTSPKTPSMSPPVPPRSTSLCPIHPTATATHAKPFKEHSIALIVLEATGGYERPIVAELLEAGCRSSWPTHDRSVTSQKAWANGPRPIPSMPQSWHDSPRSFNQPLKRHATPQTDELAELVTQTPPAQRPANTGIQPSRYDPSSQESERAFAK